MVPEEGTSSDAELIQGTLRGDERAFAELAGRHKTRVFGLASRFAHNSADLEDICQEVFIQAFFKLRQFRGDSPFEHWLLRIATFKCYDYLRRRKRDSGLEALSESEGENATARPAAPNANLERLDAALAQLSAKERLVITLLEIEDRSVQEVAALTGWSAANVKVRAFRARGILRKLLEQKP
jgi:RNA polymerase sigma-70 factor (ECF subfamily)